MKKKIYIHVSSKNDIIAIFTKRKHSNKELLKTGNVTIYTYKKVKKDSFRFNFCPNCGNEFDGIDCVECGFDINSMPPF